MGINTRMPKDVARKVHRLTETAKALEDGTETYFSITRLTSLKSLCQAHNTAICFVLYLAERTLEKMGTAAQSGGERASELIHYQNLGVQAVAVMKAYIAAPTPDNRSALYTSRSEVQALQNEIKRIGWNEVRMIRSKHLLTIENALYCFTSPESAPFWAYQAAKNYTEKYDPHYGTGLIPDSVPMLKDIILFWNKYYTDWFDSRTGA